MIESVAVRQRGAFDFETHYDNLCALQSSCPLPAVKGHLSEGVLDINGDRIRANDWMPILNTVRINKTLGLIAVRSYYQSILDEQEAKNIPGRRKTPAIRSKEITYRLCKALKECLGTTPALTCLELQGLPLRRRDLASLARGVVKNNTLQHLSLEYGRIGDSGLETICKGVKNSASVTSLNFTGCSLTWKGADILAKLIKHQATRRHNEAWQDSLRYRRPDLDRMPGIRRITCNCNPMLGDQGALVLGEALKDDLWLKALDLQQCGLTDVGAKALLEVMKYNTYLVVLDIRQNPMTDQTIIRNIMEHLLINSNGQETEYKWIKAEPIQDSQRSEKPKKRRTKTLQSSFGRKTTIKLSGGRRRTKSAGMSASRSLQPINSELIKPGPGMPWRTALRAARYKGYPPDQPVGKASLYENISAASSPTSSPKHEATIRIEYSTADDTNDTGAAVRASTDVEDSEEEFGSHKEMKVELEQLRRRLREETAARAKAEERVLELTRENKRQRQEMQQPRHGLLDDEQVLESIEASFNQFHAFLDLLRDAGLGQLITMAGLDQTPLPKLRPSSRPDRHSLSRDISFSNKQVSAAREAVRLSGHGINYPPSSTPAHYVPGSDISRTDSGRKARVIHPHLFPENYDSFHDPTMHPHQQAPLDQSLDLRQPSKFDQLYQKVLKETDGVLMHGSGGLDNRSVDRTMPDVGSLDLTAGERALSNGVTLRKDPDDRSHPSEPPQHSRASHRSRRKKPEDPGSQSDHSQHSQGSNRSRRSQKSVEDNQQSFGESNGRGPEPPRPKPRQQLTNSKSQPVSKDASTSEKPKQRTYPSDQNQSRSFDKSQYSETAEEMHENIQGLEAPYNSLVGDDDSMHGDHLC